MGIKFHCPNGHKLNVKAFLAGKKGVCPKCGARMRIPTASEPALSHGDAAHGAGADGDAHDSELDEVGDDEHPAKSNGSGAVRAPAVSAATAGSHGASAHDPISEAPAAIWYVRPPTGGQYGPARGDIMRKWIDEGRVSSDSLVWREGWTDWQNAGKLFPTLQAAGSAAPAPAPAAATLVSTTVPISPRSSLRTGTRYQDKKRDSSTLAIVILAGLALLCIVLTAVLVILLR